MDFLESIGLDIDNCRGQTCDNASIMSTTAPVQYNDPCSAHSRNLVGQAAGGSCQYVGGDMQLHSSILHSICTCL